MIRKIKDAYVSNQIDEMRHEVHTLKGTGGNFGYAEVFELTKRIEFEIVAGNMAGASELISELEEIAKRVELGLDVIQEGKKARLS